MAELIYCEGSIFDSEAEVIVNATNCVGAMGGGIAALFMRKYEEVCREYNLWSVKNQWNNTKPVLLPPYMAEQTPYGDSHQVLQFPTKIDFRYPSKIEYIEDTFPLVIDLLNSRNIKTVAFPLLGCGLGGLKEEDVLPIMTKYLTEWGGDSAEIWIYKA